MPRSGSTVALHAARFRTKIFEPFNPTELFGNTPGKFVNRNKYEFFKYANTYTEEMLKEHFDRLNSENCAIKILSNSFTDFYPGRDWFVETQEKNSHDIFVILRDLKEQMLSHMLASRFGYFHHQEISPYEFDIAESEVYDLVVHIDTFLRFLPKKARIIELGSFPEEYFDVSNVRLMPQNSLDKLRYVKNLDKIERLIDDGIKWIKPYYDRALSKVEPW